MQVVLNTEQIGVLQQILGDEGLRKNIFTCSECKHYTPYYEPQRPVGIAPYKEAGAGCCKARKTPVKKSKRPCGRFEVRGIGDE